MRYLRLRSLLLLPVAFACVLVTASRSHSDRKWRLLSQGPGSHAPPINSVIFFDELNGLKLSTLGLFSTNDGGKNWILSFENDGRRGLYTMRFTTPDKGWIVGAESTSKEDPVPRLEAEKPLILSTTDGGKTWNTVAVDWLSKKAEARFSAFTGICSNPSGTVWIAGNGGVVEGTIESNSLHVTNILPTDRELRDVACDESGEVWAVGEGGLIMHYEQNRWSSIVYLDEKAFFTGVKLINSRVWLVGGTSSKDQSDTKGLLLKSGNDGEWENRTPNGAGLLFDLAFNGREGWVVGAHGMIYHTLNEGQVWQKETSPTENDLFYIFLSQDNRGWIGGDKLTLLSLSSN